MGVVKRKLSKSFKAFFDSEKSSGFLLIICTLVSLVLANFFIGDQYTSLWKMYIGGLSLEHWVNDLLMAIFFLLIGLELERELYNGELSSFKNALLPSRHSAVSPCPLPDPFWIQCRNAHPSGSQIPMATDIAFALGVLALLGSRVPASLKVFVVAYAVIDDLCAIIIIAVFLYRQTFYSGIFAYRTGSLGTVDRLKSFENYVNDPVFDRWGDNVVFDAQIGSSRNDCRSFAGFRNSFFRQRR